MSRKPYDCITRFVAWCILYCIVVIDGQLPYKCLGFSKKRVLWPHFYFQELCFLEKCLSYNIMVFSQWILFISQACLLSITIEVKTILNTWLSLYNNCYYSRHALTPVQVIVFKPSIITDMVVFVSTVSMIQLFPWSWLNTLLKTHKIL